ncbi:MAG: hypothetical protein ACHQ50_06520, partial [Fimbriimonadales bacterium]
YGAARSDLYELFERVSGAFMPGMTPGARRDILDAALHKAYFNGHRPSHSVISGFRLIATCPNEDKSPHSEYEPTKALVACEIGAFGMLFHDGECRDTLTREGIPPIPFETFPYAATLMFADALQDDRRDIDQPSWHRDGVLESLEVDATKRCVRATVNMLELPELSWWPYKIAEYENVLSWINQRSDIRFEIDYRTKAGLMVAP